MTQQEGWPAPWTRLIGHAVARRRRVLGISAQTLSDRCADLGATVPRNTIANLENGRKEGIPVHELVVLAAALDVSPIELLCPVEDVEAIPVLPGNQVDTLRVADWLSGLSAIDAAPGSTAPDEVGGALSAYRRHDDALRRYLRARRLRTLRMVNVRLLGDGENRDVLHEQAQVTEQEAGWALNRVRGDLSRVGLRLPDIDPDVALAIGDETPISAEEKE